MTTCQTQATEKKLERTARQDYVNNCLTAKPVEEKPKSKMAMCNEKTKGMTKAEARQGAERVPEGLTTTSFRTRLGDLLSTRPH